MREDYFTLKLKLMQDGIKIEKSTFENLQGALYNDYVTCNGIMLKIGGNYYDKNNINQQESYLKERELVTAHINNTSKFTLLTDKNGNFIVQHEDGTIYNDIALSKPMLNQNENSPVAIHGDRIRVSLVTGCSGDCKFCGLNKLKYNVNNTKKIQHDINHILKLKNNITRLFFTGGNPLEKDLGKVLANLKKLVKVYSKKGIKNFDFMFAPRGMKKYFYSTNYANKYETFLRYLKHIGITTIAIDIEMFDENLLAKYAPFKSKIGISNYLLILEKAVNIFGKEHVRSNIIVGIEPIDSTIKAIKKLAQINVQPCLSPYEPYKQLPEIKKPSWEFLWNVFIKSKQICDSYNIKIAPSIHASDTHNSVASAQEINLAKSELDSFYCNVNQLKIGIKEE